MSSEKRVQPSSEHASEMLKRGIAAAEACGCEGCKAWLADDGPIPDPTPKVDEWVNAVIEVVIPMNLPHHATKTEKLDGAEQEYADLELPTDFVATISWEDAPVSSPSLHQRIEGLIAEYQNEAWNSWMQDSNERRMCFEFASRLRAVLKGET